MAKVLEEAFVTAEIVVVTVSWSERRQQDLFDRGLKVSLGTFGGSCRIRLPARRRSIERKSTRRARHRHPARSEIVQAPGVGVGGMPGPVRRHWPSSRLEIRRRRVFVFVRAWRVDSAPRAGR